MAMAAIAARRLQVTHQHSAMRRSGWHAPGSLVSDNKMRGALWPPPPNLY
jgi:hypothetical protein